MDHVAAHEEALAFNKGPAYHLDAPIFVDVLDGFEEGGGVLLSQLFEEVELEDVGLDGLVVLGCAEDEDVGVVGRYEEGE